MKTRTLRVFFPMKNYTGFQELISYSEMNGFISRMTEFHSLRLISPPGPDGHVSIAPRYYQLIVYRTACASQQQVHVPLIPREEYMYDPKVPGQKRIQLIRAQFSRTVDMSESEGYTGNRVLSQSSDRGNANADDATVASSLTFMANDAIKVEDPKIDFFGELNTMIEAVREGYFSMDGDSDDPRNLGIQNSISRIDHFMDHITKEHTKIGSYSNALSNANERSELLSINVQTVRSEVIGMDIGEALMKFNQLSNSYQAMLSTVAKINSMSLLNYM